MVAIRFALDITSECENTVGIGIGTARNGASVVAQVRSRDGTNVKRFTTWEKRLFVVHKLNERVALNDHSSMVSIALIPG